MKVGTDSIVLSSLVPGISPNNVLDIGTGSGIIALCMAQIYLSTNIMAIDIDKNSISEASLNFKNSKFHSRLIAMEIDLLKFSNTIEEKYDLIITNPPYFISSLESPNQTRNKARHTSSLSYDMLIESSKELLSHKGILSIILPNKESSIFIEKARGFKFNLIKRVSIYSKPNKECERVVLNLRAENKSSDLIETQEYNLTLRNIDNTPTQEYISLVSKFLL